MWESGGDMRTWPPSRGLPTLQTQFHSHDREGGPVEDHV